MEYKFNMHPAVVQEKFEPPRDLCSPRRQVVTRTGLEPMLPP